MNGSRQVMHMRVLLVGDPVSLSIDVCGKLRNRGHQIADAPVDAAWEVFQREQPHLVVLSRIDEAGLGFCRKIRATGDGRHVLVLALVTDQDLQDLPEAVEAGVDDCLRAEVEEAYLDGCLALVERRVQKRMLRGRIEEELAALVRQQAAVADLGLFALENPGLRPLLDHAVEKVAETLDVELCKVLKLYPADGVLVLQAGIGWEEELIGKATVEAGTGSQAGYTLLTSEPVVVEDLRTETRFEGTSLLHDHDVVSGMSVVIGGDGQPYGVLAVHTRTRREFGKDDVNFLQAVANVLAEAVERQRAERALLHERNFVSAVLDTAGALILVLDADGRIVQFNKECEQVTGYAFQDVQGRYVWDLFLRPEEVEPVKEVFRRLRAGQFPMKYENRWLTKDGADRLIAWSNTALVDEDGEVEFVVAIGIDITERRQVEEALKESEARARAILQTTVDGIITIDAYGHIESFNEAAERIFGYEAEEVIGKNVSVLMPSPYQEEHDGYLQSYRETGRRRIIGIGREVVGRRKDGSLFPLDLAVSEINLGDRTIFTGVVRDITERRSLEQEILRISEQERRRIGQDLHDGLGQMLTGLGLISQSLTRRLREQQSALAEELGEMTEMIREADQFARGLARGLVPVDLAADGLASALQRLAGNAERLFGIRCTFDQAGSALVHNNTMATHLYRIAQEAVSNAVKHGRARHVKISLAGSNGQLRLRVQDDGIGFPEELDEESRGMGVRIMHYRARMIGARLEIADGANGGTTVTCTLRNLDAPIPMGGEEYGRRGAAGRDATQKSNMDQT